VIFGFFKFLFLACFGFWSHASVHRTLIIKHKT
jgi:hypothetical protein